MGTSLSGVMKHGKKLKKSSKSRKKSKKSDRKKKKKIKEKLKRDKTLKATQKSIPSIPMVVVKEEVKVNQVEDANEFCGPSIG